MLRTHQYMYDGIGIGSKIEQNKIDNQAKALNKIRNKSEYLKEGVKYLEDSEKTFKRCGNIFRDNGNRGKCSKNIFSTHV